MPTARTSSLDVNYGEVMSSMTFDWNAQISANAGMEYFTGTGGATSCSGMRALVYSQFAKEPETSLTIIDSKMNASDMNKLLYCLITAPFVDSDGISEYLLANWSDLNGTLSPYVI